MKPRSAFRLVRSGSRNLAIALISLLAANAAQSATLYWDTNGATAGSGVATGIWGTSNFWDTASDGITSASFTYITTAADNLVIAAGTTGSAGVINVNGAQSANSITFDDNVAITLTGTSINLGSSSGAGVFVASGDNAANTISTGLVLGTATTIQNAGTGVLTVNTSSITGTGNLTLQNNSTTAGGIALSGIMVNNVGSITNTGTSTGGVTIIAIIGTNVTGVTQNSSGSTLTLSGTNLYSGDTKSTLGTLIISNNLALQNSALDTSGSGVVTLSSATAPTFGGLKGSTNLASVITTGYTSMTALTLNPGSGVSNTYGGIIANGSGATTLTLTGAYGPGTQVLTGANSYTGTTTISGGTLQIGNGTTGSLNGTTGTALTFNTYGGTFNVMEAASSTQSMGALTFSAGSNTVNSTFNATSAALTFSSLTARTAGASANFTTTGGANGSTNSINLTGVAAGFVDKGIYFNGADFAAMNAAGTYVRALAYGTDVSTAAVNTITASNHVELTATPAARTGDTLLSLNLAGSGVGYTMNSGSLTVPGILKSGGGSVGIISGGTSVTTASNAELVIRTDTASDLLKISTPITGFSGGLTKTGAGTLTLDATNTYTGTTSVVAGKLAESSTGLIADTSALTINGPTAIFDLGASHNDSVGAVTLDGGGQITGSGTSTLSGSSYTLKNGTITAGLGNAAITKSTKGTVTLTGNNANMNQAATSTGGGSLAFSGSTAYYYSTGALNIDTGSNVTVSGGASVQFNNGNTNIGKGSANNSLVVTGPRSTYTSGSNFYVGSNAQSGNSLTVSNGATVGAFTFFISDGNGGSGQNNSVTITGAGSACNVSGVFEWDSNNSGQLAVLNGGTLSTMSGTNYIMYYGNAKNNTILVDGANSVWNMGTVNTLWSGSGTSTGNAITVSNGGLINFTQNAGSGGGSNFININSNGVFSATQLSLNAATVMTFNGGILKARNTNASFVTGGAITLAGTGTVDTNTFNSTISSAISGPGALTKAGAGTLTVSGTNTYAGGAVVSGGTLLAAAAANLPSGGNLTINAGGNFSMQNSAAVTTYAANSLILAGGANLTFDLVGTNTVDKLTSTNAATTSGGNIGISINGVTTPAVNTATPLISSANGGLLTGSTHYFVANNTNYIATLAESDTAVNITGYTGGVTALTNAYWLGGAVTNAVGSMSLSSGTTSNWASAAAGTSANGVVPGGSGVNVIFGATGGAQQANVAVDSDMALGSVTFNDSAAVTIGGSHVITLNSASGTAATTSAALATVTAGSAISVTSFANATNTINANIALAAAQTWNIAAGKSLAVGGNVYNGGFGLSLAGTGDATISGSILGANGTGGLTQSTTGTVTLSAANTYSGTTTVSGGTLTLSGLGTLGSTTTASLAALTLGGGKLDLGATSQTVGAVSITTALGGGNNTIQNGNLTGTSYAASNTSGNAIVTANLLMNASGSAGLTVSGSNGTLTLTGANTYIGTTNVSSAAATLQIGNNTTTGSLSPSSAITLTNATATLAFNRSNTITQGSDFASVISGAGIVSQIGSGTLTLNGANTYSGGTKVSSGTLTAGSATALGTGTLTISGGALDSSVASLAMTSNNVQVWNADFAFAGTNSLNLGTGTVSLGSTAGNRMVTVTANTLSVGGIISNGTATGLTKAGDGTLILSGNNGYTGTTGINAGTLAISGSGKLGATTSALTLGGGTLDLGATSRTQGAVSITAAAASGNTIQNGSLTGTAYTASNSAGNAIVTANLLVNGAAGLTKSGAGTLTLSGTGNTYSGGNIVNNGTLALSVGSTLGATTNALTLGGGALDLGTTSQTAGAVSLTAAAASGDTLKNGSLTGTSYAVSNSSGNTIISANLLVNGAAGLAMSGAGTLTLSGANTYSGGTSISNGTVVMSGSGTLGSTSSSLVVNSLATLDLNGTSQQVNALTGSGGMLLNNATGTATTLTVASGTYDGAIADHTSGTGTLALTKTTSGTLTLSNTNTYTGATTINGGKLALTGYLGDTAIAANPGATFAANPASGGTLYAGASTTTGSSSLILYGGASSAGDFSMVDNAVGTFRLGSGGLTTITSTVLPMLSFDIGNSAGSIDLLDLGTMGGSAAIASGTLLDFFALSGATGLATGDYNFLTAAGGLGASAFTLKNSTITVNGHGYTFSLANSTSSQEILTVANAITTIGTTYTLAATASAPKIHVGGASTVTATITNTGLSSSYADTLDYTHLTVSNAAQLNGTWPKAANALPIANDDGTDTHSGSITALTSAGAYTFTPSIASATNHTIGNGGGAPVLMGTTPVTVDVYALASPNAISGNIGNYHVGVAKALSLTNGTAGTHNEDLNVGITAVTNTTVSGSVSGLLAGATDSNHLWVTLGGGGAATGEVTVDLTSAGTVNGTSNTLGITNLTSQTVAISGSGYNLAAAASTQTVNIGTMHVGGTSSALVTLTNSAPVDATYTETLSSNGFSSPTSSITTSGSVSGIVGGGSGSGTLSVGLDASVTAGPGKSGTTTVALNSTEVNSSGLGTTSVGSQTITVTGDVFNGSGKWTLASGTSGSWGTHANWIDSNGSIGAPGTFAGFDNVDTATFDGTGTTATIELDSAAPSLKALTLGGTSYTIAQGTGTNKLTLKSNTGTATVTATGTQAIHTPLTLTSNSTFGTALVTDALTISGNVDGAGSLTKTGGGTLTLAGSNSYSGVTTISGGILSFGAAANLPTNATNITFNNGGRLEYTGTSSVGNYTFTGGNDNQSIVVSNAAGNVNAVRSGGNYSGLWKDGPGTLTYAGDHQDSGGMVIVAGTVILSNNGSRADWYSATNSMEVQSGATLKISSAGNGNGVIYREGGFTMSGGTFDLNGVSWSTTDQNYAYPTISGSGTVTNNAASTTATAVFKNTTATFSGNIIDGASGTGKVAIYLNHNTGTWTLSGDNTYSGATTLTNGTLQAGSTTAFSPNSAYNIAAGKTMNLANYSNSIGSLTGVGNVPLGTATLTLGNDNTSPAAFSGAISSSGSPVTSLVKTGSGIQTLSGANTYTGATNITQGTLKLALGSSTNNIAGSANINIASGAVLDVSGLSGTHLALASGQTLKGAGSVTGGSVTVSSGATLSPGASVGTLNLGGGLSLAAGGLFNWENATSNTQGSAGTNWSVANVTGTTLIDSSGSSGAKLNLQFTNGSTNFSDTFWNATRTWDFITGGVSGTNLFDTSNIAIIVNGISVGTGNTITDEGAFSTVVSGSDLQLKWSALVTGNNSKLWVGSAEPTTSLETTSVSHAFGRVLAGSTQSANITLNSNGSDAATTNATVVASGTGISTTTTSPDLISALTVSGINATLSTGSTGIKSGAVTITNQAVDSAGVSQGSDNSTATINVTGTVVADRAANFTVDLGDIGRHLAGASVSLTGKTLNFTSTGNRNLFTDVTIGSTTYDGTTQAGSLGSQSASIASAASSGTATISVAPVNAETAFSYTPATLTSASYTATAVATRTVTAPTTTTLGTFHAGATVNVTSNAYGYSYGGGGSGVHGDTEDATVQAASLTPDANGIILSGGANNISDATGFTRSFTGTAAVSSAGGSISSAVNPEFSAATSVSAPYSIGVYSGQMVWSGATGNWSTGSDWTDSVGGGAQAAPGTDSNFAGVDSATFDAGGHTVTVDTAVNVNALSFTGASDYMLAGSSSLTLAGAAAGINVTSGAQIINAPLTLANDVAVAVTSGSLAIGGNISAAGSQTLTKNGVGTLTLSGANSYGGNTTVNTGTLYINGANTGLGTVTVEPLA
ncbi:MAG: autotransporter-associated beta strand repeat-containing protein, partial [Verrucomicrobiota bacterium]